MTGVCPDYIRMLSGEVGENEVVAYQVGGVGKVIYRINENKLGLSKERIAELCKLVYDSEPVATSEWFKLGFNNHFNKAVEDALYADADIELSRESFEHMEFVKFIVYTDFVIAIHYKEFESASGTEYGYRAYIYCVHF